MSETYQEVFRGLGDSLFGQGVTVDWDRYLGGGRSVCPETGLSVVVEVDGHESRVKSVSGSYC